MFAKRRNTYMKSTKISSSLGGKSKRLLSDIWYKIREKFCKKLVKFNFKILLIILLEEVQKQMPADALV